MEYLIIGTSVLVYIMIGTFTYGYMTSCNSNKYIEKDGNFIRGLLWPLTITYFAIRLLLHLIKFGNLVEMGYNLGVKHENIRDLKERKKEVEAKVVKLRVAKLERELTVAEEELRQEMLEANQEVEQSLTHS